MTDGRGSPLLLGRQTMLPGAMAKAMLPVIATVTAVEMRLRLKSSD